MKFTAATIVTILSSAVAFSPNSILSKSVITARPMVASQAVDTKTGPRNMAGQLKNAKPRSNGQRKKTKEVSYTLGYTNIHMERL